MVWERPAEVEYPSIWHRFKGRRPDADGLIPTFRVQDAPPEMFDQICEFMAREFCVNEPMCKSLEIFNDEEGIQQFMAIWRNALKAKLVLVCLKENPSIPGEVYPDIVGTNITTISHKKDRNEKHKATGKTFPVLIGAAMHCTHLVDLFEKYGVDEYLTAFGLSVDKKYWGQNIGAEILRARVPMCKAVGIKLTGTIFTAITSQVLARKVGFKEEGAISFKDLDTKHGLTIPNIETEYIQLMSLKIE